MPLWEIALCLSVGNVISIGTLFVTNYQLVFCPMNLHYAGNIRVCVRTCMCARVCMCDLLYDDMCEKREQERCSERAKAADCA